MTVAKKLGKVLLVATCALAGLEAAQWTPPAFGLVSPAEAKVGRPLTPVSVAGVARRTARRCNAGVYNC